jgi:hypothetical protein
MLNFKLLYFWRNLWIEPAKPAAFQTAMTLNFAKAAARRCLP